MGAGGILPRRVWGQIDPASHHVFLGGPEGLERVERRRNCGPGLRQRIARVKHSAVGAVGRRSTHRNEVGAPHRARVSRLCLPAPAIPMMLRRAHAWPTLSAVRPE